MTDTAAQRPPRSMTLTGWLIFVALSNLWFAYRSLDVIRDLVDHSDPRWEAPLTWALPLSMALSVVGALCAVAMIFRLKLGFYAYIAAVVVSYGVSLFVLGATLTSLLLPAVGVVATITLVNSRWFEFES